MIIKPFKPLLILFLFAFALPAFSADPDGEGYHAADNCPNTYNPDQADNDADGLGDVCDPDDDNDGWIDEEETSCSSDPFDDGSFPIDTDGDLLCDEIDLDDDNDGTPDISDDFPFDPTEDTDTDNDGIGNNADPDDDNDGVLDENDPFPLTLENMQTVKLMGPNPLAFVPFNVSHDVDLGGDSRNEVVIAHGPGQQLTVYSTPDLSQVLWSADITNTFGVVRGINDSNTDGTPDLLMMHTSGLCRLSGVDGAVLGCATSTEISEGADFYRVGDADSDGVEDILVVDYGWDNPGGATNVGILRLVSSMDGSVIATQWLNDVQDQMLGREAVVVPDANNDGLEDVVACVDGESTCHVFSGDDLSLIRSHFFTDVAYGATVNGQTTYSNFYDGVVLSSWIDANDDGFDDYMIEVRTQESEDWQDGIDSTSIDDYKGYRKVLDALTGNLISEHVYTWKRFNSQQGSYYYFSMQWDSQSEPFAVGVDVEGDSTKEVLALSWAGSGHVDYGGAYYDIYLKDIANNTGQWLYETGDNNESEKDGRPIYSSENEAWFLQRNNNNVWNLYRYALDRDGDNLTDGHEVALGTDSADPDSDDDGVNDGDELAAGLDPLNPDSDADGSVDGADACPLDGLAFAVDTDGDGLCDGGADIDDDDDGLSDADETGIYGTDPLLVDTDADGFDDFEEIMTFGTDPLVFDNDNDADGQPDAIDTDDDNDGLSDDEEINTWGTDPLSADTDSDGFSDYDEIVTHGTDPLSTNYDNDSDGVPDVVDTDDDNDGMPDAWELANNLDPLFDDGWRDEDLDGWDNEAEFNRGSDPWLFDDADGDGSGDGYEQKFSTDPNDPAYRSTSRYLIDGWGDTYGGHGRSVSSAGDVDGDGVADFLVGNPDDASMPGALGSVTVYSGAGFELMQVFDDEEDDDFANDLAPAGDVNADGYDDLIVGIRYDDTVNGVDSGSAKVFSGLDGAMLYELHGQAADDWFGTSVNAAGDMNGDGYDDFMVSATGEDANGSESGSLRVYSGLDATVLYTFTGEEGEYMGASAALAGDVNGDGYDDLVIGVHLGKMPNSNPNGAALVISGLDGSQLYRLEGQEGSDYFGYAVDTAGDVNQDGYDDVLVGAFRAEGDVYGSGAVYVYSGVDGALLYRFSGEGGNDEFGRSVSGAGDVNGDGYPDILVGAPEDAEAGYRHGVAYVYSGNDGKLIRKIKRPYSVFGEDFGADVNSLGDLDGDGYGDFIIGAPNGVSGGNAWIYDGDDLMRDFDGDNWLDAYDTDDDNDGMPDNWEILYGFDPLNVGDADDDMDGDMVANLDEYLNGTDPSVYDDSDSDGSPNGAEVIAQTDPYDSGSRPSWRYQFYGDSSYGGFGDNVDAVGDINGDGYADVIVGAPNADGPTNDNRGKVKVFSGFNGEVLHESLGEEDSGGYGSATAGLGDLNGDGYDDFAVGAAWFDGAGSSRGAVYVYSGVDNQLIYFYEGANGELIGQSLDVVDDLNNDGLQDFIVGGEDLARVYSGADGSLIYELFGQYVSDEFGYEVAGAGDTNGDGYGDFLVGVPNRDDNGSNSGAARLYSGINGSLIYQINGTDASDYLGDSMDGLGDINNDGYDDFIVGAHNSHGIAYYAGEFRVISGIDGTELFVFLGNEDVANLGISVANAGDINADGYTDFVAGAYRAHGETDDDDGAAYVYSGKNGNLLATVYGSRNDGWLGYAVSGAGDTDGDGYDDLIVGIRNERTNGTGAGAARVYSGVDLLNDPDGDNWVNSADADDDDDGMPDDWENLYGFDQFNASDAAGNADADGYTNLEEYTNGTNPLVPDVSTAANDTDGDYDSDIIWRNSNDSAITIWEIQDRLMVGESSISGLGLDYDLIDTNDLDADGDADFILFKASAGQAIAWEMQNHAKVSGSLLATFSGYTIRGLGDVDADGDADIVWQNETWGGVIIWIMEGGAKQSGAFIGTLGDGSVVEAVGDFDNDGDADLMWSVPGVPSLVRWDMENGGKQAGAAIGGFTGYSITHVGDFNKDGTDDLVWEPDSGTNSAIIWLMQNGDKQTGMAVGTLPNYSIGTVGDYDADGDDDLFWYNPDYDVPGSQGGAIIWELENGAKVNGDFVDTITNAAEVRP